MIQNDLGGWPLVLSVASGKPDLPELQAYSAEWTSWLDRGEPFALLKIFLDSDAHSHPRGAAQEEKRWFAANGERLKKQVLGMATVAPTDVVEKINNMDTDRLFGVPVLAFTTVDAALDWLLPLFEAKAVPVDAQALKAHVLQLTRLRNIHW